MLLVVYIVGGIASWLAIGVAGTILWAYSEAKIRVAAHKPIATCEDYTGVCVCIALGPIGFVICLGLIGANFTMTHMHDAKAKAVERSKAKLPTANNHLD